MTKKEAQKIPSMRIEVTPFVEDCFFYLLGQENQLSEKQKEKALNRVSGKDYSLEEYYKAMLLAKTMIENNKKYGVPCADWCN